MIIFSRFFRTLPVSLAVCAVFFSQPMIASEAMTSPINVDTTADQHSNHPLVYGMSIGDVQADQAIIWSRTDKESYMHVRIKGRAAHQSRNKTIKVTAHRDFTGKIRLENLRPDSEYRYYVWFSDNKQARKVPKYAKTGQFSTAPKAQQAVPLSFAWGGDLAGQNVCRDVNEGFPIFKAINAMDLDFFIGLGDMIYADGTCSETGLYGNTQIPGQYNQASDMANYWAHWQYNQADEAFQELLKNTPYYAIWDDHEVVNDFGPLHDTRSNPPYTEGEHLLPKGLQAFLDYNPVAENNDHPKRLYQTIRWGKHFELFVLDTRQYRDANSTQDNNIIKKTLLGREQLTWLKKKLMTSDATWKMIVSSVPISIPTGWPPENGRDGWANYDQEGGFEQELQELFGFMRDNNINRSIWVTTDVHFASAFRYTPFSETPDFQVYEFVTGPLNAGLFPNQDYDTSFGTERLFFYGPEDSISEYEDALPWMNYGAVAIDENGELQISIHDVNGNTLFTQELSPQ